MKKCVGVWGRCGKCWGKCGTWRKYGERRVGRDEGKCMGMIVKSVAKCV